MLKLIPGSWILTLTLGWNEAISNAVGSTGNSSGMTSQNLTRGSREETNTKSVKIKEMFADTMKNVHHHSFPSLQHQSLELRLNQTLTLEGDGAVSNQSTCTSPAPPPCSPWESNLSSQEPAVRSTTLGQQHIKVSVKSFKQQRQHDTIWQPAPLTRWKTLQRSGVMQRGEHFLEQWGAGRSQRKRVCETTPAGSADSFSYFGFALIWQC